MKAWTVGLVVLVALAAATPSTAQIDVPDGPVGGVVLERAPVMSQGGTERNTGSHVFFSGEQ